MRYFNFKKYFLTYFNLKIFRKYFYNLNKLISQSKTPLKPCLFNEKWFSENYFLKIFYVCLLLESWSTENIFQLKETLTWFSGKYFLFILGGKYFSEAVKNLEMSCYLLIISNLILKLLIAIYFVLNLFFSVSFFRI
jgi:hypothetical protein